MSDLARTLLAQNPDQPLRLRYGIVNSLAPLMVTVGGSTVSARVSALATTLTVGSYVAVIEQGADRLVLGEVGERPSTLWRQDIYINLGSRTGNGVALDVGALLNPITVTGILHITMLGAIGFSSTTGNNWSLELNTTAVTAGGIALRSTSNTGAMASGVWSQFPALVFAMPVTAGVVPFLELKVYTGPVTGANHYLEAHAYAFIT